MRIALISAGIDARYLRLQPFRTLVEMCRQLAVQGHRVAVISNSGPETAASDEFAGVPVCRVPRVSLTHLRDNGPLMELLTREAPEMVFVHLGLSSFLHQDLRFPLPIPVVGIVTSPIHCTREILRIGVRKVASNLDLIANHLASSIVPAWMIRRAFDPDGGLCGLVTLSETTRQYLIAKGAPREQVWVVPPGVDDRWLAGITSDDERQATRAGLGLRADDVMVTYFGSPAPVRGVTTLLRALGQVIQTHPEVKLLMLSRRWTHEWRGQTERLQALTTNGPGQQSNLRFLDGYLDQEELIRYVDASHVVCLPFELLPSDVPLSVLEAMALGQGVITTTIACIPELVGADRGFLIPPASIPALTQHLRLAAEQPHITRARGRQARQYIATQRTWEAMGAALKRVTEMAGTIR